MSLHLFPVPSEPFHSNPLRSPIVIPLDVDAVAGEGPRGAVLHGLPPRGSDEMMRMFQVRPPLPSFKVETP